MPTGQCRLVYLWGMDEHVFDAQALRMLKAYFNVGDPKVRELIIKLAESAASGAKATAQSVEGQSPAKLN